MSLRPLRYNLFCVLTAPQELLLGAGPSSVRMGCKASLIYLDLWTACAPCAKARDHSTQKTLKAKTSRLCEGFF